MSFLQLFAARPSGCVALFLVLLLPVGALAQEPAQAGIAAAVEGRAWAVDLEQKERPLTQGAAVYVGELVRTECEAKVRLQFLDQSVMDVGPDSEVRISSLVYDPDDEKKSSQVLSMIRGLFRFVTGAITRQNPENLSMQAPLASVGIRGTITDHYVEVVEEVVDGTPVHTVNSELHALRESTHNNVVVVTRGTSKVVLDKPDMVADVQLDIPMVARELSSFEKRHFGEVAIEPYSFDPEVHKGLHKGFARPVD